MAVDFANQTGGAGHAYYGGNLGNVMTSGGWTFAATIENGPASGFDRIIDVSGYNQGCAIFRDNGNPIGIRAFAAYPNIDSGTWTIGTTGKTRICFEVDTTTGYWFLYFNGVLQAYGGGALEIPLNNIGVGNDFTTSPNVEPWLGKISEVAYYPRRLTPLETFLYAAGGGVGGGLAPGHYYPMFTALSTQPDLGSLTACDLTLQQGGGGFLQDAGHPFSSKIKLGFMASATPGATGGATGPKDSTGCRAIAIKVAWDPTNQADLTIADSAGNTWIPLTKQTVNGTAVQVFYVLAPNTSASHTFSATSGSATSPVIHATGLVPGVGFDIAFDAESGNTTTGGSPISCGTITPSANDCALLAAYCGYVNDATLIDDDLAIYIAGRNVGVNVPAAFGMRMQPGGSGVAVTPSFTFGGGTDASAAFASFKPVSTGGNNRRRRILC